MSDEPLFVECDCHGKSVAAAVCGHLVGNNGVALGFIENSSDPDDLQGWCFACEHMFLMEGDRTEKFVSFCHHTLVCRECYQEIKKAHDVGR